MIDYVKNINQYVQMKQNQKSTVKPPVIAPKNKLNDCSTILDINLTS